MGGIATKKYIKLSITLAAVLALMVTLSVPAFAITEAEVEAQVAASSKEAVTGNVLIWFLCAIGFLKVSQKIDSFMASLGVNVGHTGGSMLAEAMIATRGVSTIASGFGHALGGLGRRGSSAPSGASGGSSPGGVLKGGLAGVVSRKVTSDAVKTATTATSAVNTVKSKATSTAAQSSAVTDRQSSQSDHTGQKDTQVISSQGRTVTHEKQTTASHTDAQRARDSSAKTDARTVHASASSARTQTHTASTFRGVGLGGALFAKSLLTGGSFANDVIGTVARGDLRSTGSITGDLAAQSLQSYMGYTALGEGAKDVPAFSNVEIGGGRITGAETAPGSTEGLPFGMYHAEQYTAPQGEYTKVHSADGTLWYKQYAQDVVERKPYEAPDGTVAYHEKIVKKLPDPPKRKDRM